MIAPCDSKHSREAERDKVLKHRVAATTKALGGARGERGPRQDGHDPDAELSLYTGWSSVDRTLKRKHRARRFPTELKKRPWRERDGSSLRGHGLISPGRQPSARGVSSPSVSLGTSSRLRDFSFYATCTFYRAYGSLHDQCKGMTMDLVLPCAPHLVPVNPTGCPRYLHESPSY